MVNTGSRAERVNQCPHPQSQSPSCNQNHPALIYMLVLPTDAMEWDFHQLKKGDLILERTLGQAIAQIPSHKPSHEMHM